MLVSRVILKNWRNFRHVDVEMGSRVFLVGPNASGKSNFLDVFRFLRDITKDNGSLQSALTERGGLGKIRCLAARQTPDVEIEVYISETPEDTPLWKYKIGIKTETGGTRKPILSCEKVWHNDELVLNRPDDNDMRDKERLRYTHLEQVNANKDFRDIAHFFNALTYLHIVPQLVRFASAYTGPGIESDPFGRSFLERISGTTQKIRDSRLKKIEQLLKKAVPQLVQLQLVKDEATGHPHLEAKYTHWRPQGAWQREDQFSDGTLRLIGLLWALQEGDSMLLLEEPELSLHSSLVMQLPVIMHKMQKLLKKRQRQIIMSTHSYELLNDKSIGDQEVLIIKPSHEGSTVNPAAASDDISLLLKNGMSIGDAIMPQTAPQDIFQLSLLD